MGENLFLMLIGGVLLISGTDLFVRWYTVYLSRRNFPAVLQRHFVQIQWVVLSLFFWNLLYRNFLPQAFTLSHVLFALFIFSLRGLILSFLPKKE
ncbi:MAG TPA: hypothetical protein ENJ29_14365 [Bacteroidetes bacterium]|nr:hypothetical protein [Bacteroidota bacterium]